MLTGKERGVDAVAAGHYYRKQLGCKSKIIAWSHRSRFRVGLGLIGSSVPKLLDYGCGDGTFLAMAADRIRQGCGADLAAGQTDDCRERLASFANLRFCTVSDLGNGTHDGAYDVVTCMETLEHCTVPIVEVVLRDLARLVSPGGRVIISVPIEIGPTFLLKTIVRRLAAWRGLSDYRYYESYTLRDTVRMVLAGRTTVLDRPVYGGAGESFHSHYGFNWRALREQVSDHLAIERTLFSPLGILGGWVSSQAWFVCGPPSSSLARTST
jgi:2-polyprenyl-3-methyl-5-hydroxy-6-metoxy-1,4-benzoquinol methylase